MFIPPNQFFNKDRSFQCSVPHTQAPHHAPATFLCSLPIPHRSHGSPTDFLTGLPPWGRNTTILIFSQGGSFRPSTQVALCAGNCTIPDPSCYLAPRTGHCGPHFSFQISRVFCQALGVSSSWSSGYHLKVNQELKAALRCLAS